ncbi:hypothetical protein QR680_012030 [Steinernema hermaphroditum]|uniref:EGF-like domain-containing protein n=1 Tax=Steinernema hermaphroditum TaxID=289476 RepID=A0AA39LZT9_9BILA|nr:hypothetical protein QR680_012030 [Steinernema hermaphroditum]
MFPRLLVAICLVSVTVANVNKCHNGRKHFEEDVMQACDCGDDFTGLYCGIPRRTFKSHTVSNTDFERFTFEDFRSSNLTEEPPLSTHQYAVYLEFQSDEGSPIELLVEHLDPVYEMWCTAGMDEALAITAKLNGKGYDCLDLYHKVHKSDEGKFVLEVFLLNGPDRYNMTFQARKQAKIDLPGLTVENQTLVLFKRIEVNTPVQTLNFSESMSYRNTKTTRQAVFFFYSPENKMIEVTIDRFPSEFDCKGTERTSGNLFMAHSISTGFCIRDDAGEPIRLFGKTVFVAVFFNYDNKADQRGFVSGEEQLQSFEFTVKKLVYDPNVAEIPEW